MKMGTITTGQSPRKDLIPALKEAIGLDLDIIERGVFDGFNREEVLNLDWKLEDYTMIALMRNGEQIKVTQRHLEEGIKKCIADLENTDVNIILLLCTGKFSKDITSTKLFLKPNVMIESIVETLSPNSRMGIIVPLLEQIPMMKKKWKITNPNQQAIFEALSPYTASEKDITKAAEKIAEIGIDIIILDCLGYSEKVKGIFKKITRKPVLLPSTFLGNIVRTLI